MFPCDDVIMFFGVSQNCYFEAITVSDVVKENSSQTVYDLITQVDFDSINIYHPYHKWCATIWLKLLS